jgi:TatD DNase family protein
MDDHDNRAPGREDPHLDLVDIGANLGHESFDHDRATVIARAHAAGVAQIVVTGASRDGSRAALEIAATQPGRLFATAGVHPHHALEVTAEGESELRELHRDPRIVAVGECGLDYFRDLAPRPAQRRAFERQLALAVDCGKPLFLHQRDAHADFMDVMRGFEGRLGAVVVHCFTGTGPELADYVAQGWYVGITGWLCDERRGGHLRELVRGIPADRLLVETDAPYLLPRSLRPLPPHRRNEPMFLPHIVEELARDRGETVAATAAATRANARRFFDLPTPG